MNVVGGSLLPNNPPEKYVYAVHVAGVEPDGMAGLSVNILEGEGSRWESDGDWPSH